MRRIALICLALLIATAGADAQSREKRDGKPAAGEAGAPAAQKKANAKRGRAAKQAAGVTPVDPRPRLRRDDLPAPGDYYDLLRPLCSHLDIWHTVYNHVITGPDGIVEWFKGSALRPFLSALDAKMQAPYLATYTARIAQAYPARFDGKVLLRFPRLFMVAVR